MTPSNALGGNISIAEGIDVPRMGYGAMWLTGPGVWGETQDRAGARRLLGKVRDLGVRLIDTAWAYGPETSEMTVADALGKHHEMVIATKAGIDRHGPGQWEPNGHPEFLRMNVEGSLKRLDVDSIALLQLHAPASDVPIEESVGALAEMQQEGKIRHIGLSNVSVEQLRAAQTVATVVSVQNHYNLVNRSEHEAVLQACETQDIAFLAYRPIAGGDVGAQNEALADVAARHGATPSQVALAWLLQHSPVAVPIPGTTSIAHLEENVAATQISLTAEDVAALEVH